MTRRQHARNAQENGSKLLSLGTFLRIVLLSSLVEVTVSFTNQPRPNCLHFVGARSSPILHPPLSRCHLNRFPTSPFSVTTRSQAMMDTEFSVLESPFVVAAVALVLLVAAQSFINSMLKGDQGLGAFLSDGSGFQKSGFRARRGGGPNSNSETDDGAPLSGADPLPWLKLPRLDFVDVAGQKQDAMDQDTALVMDRLETLRQLLNAELEVGNANAAKQVQAELDSLMKESGFEYTQE